MSEVILDVLRGFATIVCSIAAMVGAAWLFLPIKVGSEGRAFTSMIGGGMLFFVLVFIALHYVLHK